MELTLKLLTGRSAGQEIKVPSNKFFIGRADDCHLRPHSDMVSRHHCVLLAEEGFCAIRDFGSKNGTYVNDERVVGQRELHNGDKLKIATLEFEIQLASQVGGKKRAKVKDVKDAAQRLAAGPTRGGNEDDIDNWLADEEEDHSDTRRIDSPKPGRPPHETPLPAAMNTETMFLKPVTDDTTTAKTKTATKPPVTPAADAAANAAEKERGAEAAKRLFGKPIVAGQTSKNSRDAAAEALKKFFNTRK